jgi:hypothetical protein
MKGRWKVALGSVAALLVAGGALAVWMVYASLGAVRDSYAQWDLALATIQHMKTHSDSWPQSWSELHEAYNATPELRGPQGWQDVTNIVDFDFKASPPRLLAQAARVGESPFKVIWLRNGKKHHWAAAEPNALIFDYLQKKGTEPQHPADGSLPSRSAPIPTPAAAGSRR